MGSGRGNALSILHAIKYMTQHAEWPSGPFMYPGEVEKAKVLISHNYHGNSHPCTECICEYDGNCIVGVIACALNGRVAALTAGNVTIHDTYLKCCEVIADRENRGE